MLIHRRSLPHNLLGFPKKSPVPIYTPGWREALWELSVLPKNTTQCPWPGLESEPLDPEMSALTMRPPCLHLGCYSGGEKVKIFQCTLKRRYLMPNPLIPGAFHQKCIFFGDFGWFSSNVLKKALILQLGSTPSFPLTLHFITFLLGTCRNQNSRRN